MATGDITTPIISRGFGGTWIWLKFTNLDAAGTDSLGTTPANFKGVLTVTSVGYTGSSNGAKTRTLYLQQQLRFPYSSGDILTNYAKQITIGAVTSGPFRHLETITQATSGATARVIGDIAASPIIVDSITGSPDNSHAWTGGTSGASATPVAVPAFYSAGMWRGLQGSDLWIPYMVSETVHPGETATLDVAAGIYTDGAANASRAVSGLAVTNQSAIPYPKPSLRWLPPTPLNRVITGTSGNTVYLRAIGFSMFGESLTPLAGIGITLTDQHSHSVTHVVTTPTVSAENTSVYEYGANFDTSTMTDGDVLTATASAYPLMGDSGAVTATGDGIGDAAMTFILDKTNNRLRYACVDQASGVDPGVVSATRATAEASPFATWGRAMLELGRSANPLGGNFSDLDGCVLTVKAANTQVGARFWNPQSTAGYVTIIPATGQSATASLTLPDDASSKALSNRVLFSGIAIGGTNIFSATTGDITLFSNCPITTNTVIGGKSQQIGCTSSTFTTTDAFFCTNSSTTCPASNTQVGNHFSGVTASIFTDCADGTIIYGNRYNSFQGNTGASASSMAIVNNLFEGTGTGADPSAMVENGIVVIRDQVIQGNTFPGRRVNIEDNYAGGNSAVGGQWINGSVRNNSFNYLASKVDTDENGVTGRGHPWMLGYWTLDNGQNCRSNNMEAGAFPPRYMGIAGTITDPAGYTDDQSAHGGGAGNGNYLPAVGSVLINKVAAGDATIPVDLAGVAFRDDGTDAAGAFNTAGASGPSLTISVNASSGAAGSTFSGSVTISGSFTPPATLTLTATGGTLSPTSIVTSSSVNTFTFNSTLAALTTTLTVTGTSSAESFTSAMQGFSTTAVATPTALSGTASGTSTILAVAHAADTLNFYADGVLNGSVATAGGVGSLTLTGLTPGTTYAITAKDQDAYGNLSAATAGTNVTTWKLLTVTIDDSGTPDRTISWSGTASNNYKVYKNGSLVQSGATSPYTDTGAAGTSATYEVRGFTAGAVQDARGVAVWGTGSAHLSLDLSLRL